MRSKAIVLLLLGGLVSALAACQPQGATPDASPADSPGGTSVSPADSPTGTSASPERSPTGTSASPETSPAGTSASPETTPTTEKSP